MNPRRDEIVRAMLAGEVSANLPPAPVVQQRPAQPRCPEHCARHEVDADLVCPACGGASYRLIAHEHAEGEGGHHFYSTEPVNSAPALERRQPPRCHRCGGSLNRVSPRPL
jgi:hypothetical protein